VMEPEDIHARLQALEAVLNSAEQRAQALGREAGPDAMKQAMELANFLLGRVRTGWNESGLWSPQTTSAANAAEVEAVEDVLYHRLRGVQRATLMRAGQLPAEHAARLAEFCDSLAMGG